LAVFLFKFPAAIKFPAFAKNGVCRFCHAVSSFSSNAWNEIGIFQHFYYLKKHREAATVKLMTWRGFSGVCRC